MILVDTSIWADHFRRGDAGLADLLRNQLVAIHSFVIGELALGHLRPRGAVLDHLRALPRIATAAEDAVLELIDIENFVGVGIGYVDAHLLTSARLSAGCRLWTRDRRLGAASVRMGLSFEI
jgi:predicted nucleic acid-binding protein